MEVVYKSKFNPEELQTGKIVPARYANGHLAVKLYNEYGEPCYTLSTSVEGICLAEDEFIAKTYSENEGVNEQFLGSCFEDTGKTTITGFVEVPIYRFIGLEESKV